MEEAIPTAESRPSRAERLLLSPDDDDMIDNEQWEDIHRRLVPLLHTYATKDDLNEVVEVVEGINNVITHKDGSLAQIERKVDHVNQSMIRLQATLETLTAAPAAPGKGRKEALEEKKTRQSWVIANRRLVVEIVLALLALLGIILGNLFTQ